MTQTLLLQWTINWSTSTTYNESVLRMNCLRRIRINGIDKSVGIWMISWPSLYHVDLDQARLLACGRGDVFTQSFGIHLNPIPTREDRFCPPYTDVHIKFWKPQVRLLIDFLFTAAGQLLFTCCCNGWEIGQHLDRITCQFSKLTVFTGSEA